MYTHIHKIFNQIYTYVCTIYTQYSTYTFIHVHTSICTVQALATYIHYIYTELMIIITIPGWFAGSLVQGSDSAAPSAVTGRVVWPSPQPVISTASQLSNYHNLPTKCIDQYTTKFCEKIVNPEKFLWINGNTVYNNEIYISLFYFYIFTSVISKTFIMLKSIYRQTNKHKRIYATHLSFTQFGSNCQQFLEEIPMPALVLV